MNTENLSLYLTGKKFKNHHKKGLLTNQSNVELKRKKRATHLVFATSTFWTSDFLLLKEAKKKKGLTGSVKEEVAVVVNRVGEVGVGPLSRVLLQLVPERRRLKRKHNRPATFLVRPFQSLCRRWRPSSGGSQPLSAVNVDDTVGVSSLVRSR